MNSLIETEFPLHEAQHLRYDLLRVLTDSDLAYQLPGDNPTLGELCREMGEVEQCYIQSFQTFKHDWSYRAPEPEVAGSVAGRCSPWLNLHTSWSQAAASTVSASAPVSAASRNARATTAVTCSQR